MDKHQERVISEFSRQAATLEAARFFNDAQTLVRMREAAALTPASRVIDVACGPGILVEALAPYAAEVVACDITPAMLERTVARCMKAGIENVRCVQGTAEALPFEHARFDVAVTRAALHHFPDPGAAVREIARVLRVGGRAVILDSTSSEDAEESALHNALEVLRDPSHVRMLAESELLALLPAAGLVQRSLLKWDSGQTFDEWLKTANAPERVGPLHVVMSTLANAGLRAGISLRRDESGTLRFEHHRVLVVAEKRAESLHAHALRTNRDAGTT